jgi:hypothetical protein
MTATEVTGANSKGVILRREARERTAVEMETRRMRRGFETCPAGHLEGRARAIE